MPTNNDPEYHTNAHMDVSKVHVPHRQRESYEHDHAKKLIEEHFEFRLIVDGTVFLMGVGL